MRLTETEIADLVVALISVNQFPLDRAAALVPAFKEHGLLDPERVLQMKGDTIDQALIAAGYRRGGYVPIIAYRLFPLMEAIQQGRLDPLVDSASRKDKDAFVTLLTSLHGVGPRVAQTAWMLWTG